MTNTTKISVDISDKDEIIIRSGPVGLTLTPKQARILAMQLMIRAADLDESRKRAEEATKISRRS
jgi:hypothetical protein